MSLKNILILILNFTTLSASTLNHLKTVFIIEPGMAGIEIDQHSLFVKNHEWLMIRNQNLILSVSPKTEIGFIIPQIEYYGVDRRYTKLGDVKMYMNTSTDFFSSFMLTNFYLEINTASGPKYEDINNHPMEAYGHNEYRWGFIFFKKYKFFSLHSNLFYVFKSQKESSLTDGITINILEKETYNRIFGFNPNYKENFFYKGNFSNDNMEYSLAINTPLVYPFVPFIEYTFSHDFYGKSHHYPYKQLRPGSGILNSVFSAGTKVFFVDDLFSLKLIFYIPTGKLYSLYSTGISLSARLDF